MAARCWTAFRTSALFPFLLVVIIFAVLAGCGGGGSNSGGSGSGGSGGNGGGNNCTLGLNPGFCGTLTGLPSGKTVTLNFFTSDAGSGDLTLSANGPFAYMLSTQVDISTTWNVSVDAASPGVSCTVTNQGSNGSGGVRVQEITGVTVSCSPGPDYTIGGVLAGLKSGTQVILQDNGSDSLTLTANGPFTFPTQVNQGGAYSVTVGTQPAGQLCTVNQGASTASANVTNIVVTCTDAFHIGGTLAGLNSGSRITLEDNGNDSLTLTANGAFTFAAPVTEGSTYSVTLGTQPNNQFCSITGGSGTVSGDVGSIQVACGPIEQVLYTFTANGDGWGPYASLITDSAGNLYGTTKGGGSANFGIVFKLTSNGGSYTESVLNSFKGGTSDGASPYAALIMDSAGNLYGTTTAGGSNNCSGGCGTVFKLSPDGTGGYTESVLYSFVGGTSDGANPYAGLISDSTGNFYGTTTTGGSNNCSGGCGTVFKLSPGGGGTYTESVLYSFVGGTSDGANPYAGLITDSTGNFYGTTTAGGSNNCNGGCGTVFKLSPNGGNYTESVLYSFKGGTSDGANPYAGLIMDSAGNFYGTTTSGGSGGTVFKLAPSGGGYTESVLYNLPGFGITDGASPYGSLAMDSSGNLYGTTASGGSPDCNDGCGTVFKVAPNGTGGYTGSISYDFLSGNNDGAFPFDGLVMGSTGNFYGTTTIGGSNGNCPSGCGTVFEINPH
jgi:uncharacterized repeat protein (TIGR03803 family)